MLKICKQMLKISSLSGETGFAHRLMFFFSPSVLFIGSAVLFLNESENMEPIFNFTCFGAGYILGLSIFCIFCWKWSECVEIFQEFTELVENCTQKFKHDGNISHN